MGLPVAPELSVDEDYEGAVPVCLPLRKEDLQAYLMWAIGTDTDLQELLTSSVLVWRQVWEMAFGQKRNSMVWDDAGQRQLASVEELLDATFLEWQNQEAINPRRDLEEAGRPWYWRTSGPCGNGHCPRVVEKISVTCIPECRFYY